MASPSQQPAVTSSRPHAWVILARIATVAIAGVALAFAPAPLLSAQYDDDATTEEDDDDDDEARRIRWTRDRAIGRAASLSPAVREANAELAVATAHRAYASVPVVGNPVLGVRAMFGYPDQSAATYSVFLGLPFDLSGRSERWAQETDHIVEEAEAQLDAATNTAIAEAVEAYVALAIAQEALALSDARVQLAQRTHDSIRVRVDARADIAIDLSLALTELGQAHVEHALRAAELDEARAALRAALDLDPDVSPEVAPVSGPDPPAAASLASAIQLARERRAEPRAHRAAARRYRISEDRLFAESIDLLVVGLEWETQGNQTPQSSAGVGASMALPLFRTAAGERSVARWMSWLEDERHALSERVVEREVTAAWHAFVHAIEALTLLTDEAIPAAEQALAMTETMLEAGAVDVFRVLVARHDVFELRARRLEVLREAWRARVELDRAIGVLAP